MNRRELTFAECQQMFMNDTESNKTVNYYMKHTWQCIAMLEHYRPIRNKYFHSNNHKFNIHEGNRRCVTNKIKSRNIVDRLYTLRAYTGNVHCIIRCVCECNILYSDYVWNQVVMCYNSSFTMCIKNCLNNCKNIPAWVRNQLLFKDRTYCQRHNHFIHPQIEKWRVILNEIYEQKECQFIIDCVCFHDAIILIHVDRNNRTLYGSDLHKALSAWVYYNENCSNWNERVVLVKTEKGIIIYNSFPD